MTDAVRDLADTLARYVGLNRWVLRLHGPVEIGPGAVVCWAEHKPWPCDEAATAAERLREAQCR